MYKKNPKNITYVKKVIYVYVKMSWVDNILILLKIFVFKANSKILMIIILIDTHIGMVVVNSVDILVTVEIFISF